LFSYFPATAQRGAACVGFKIIQPADETGKRINVKQLSDQQVAKIVQPKIVSGNDNFRQKL
jgi:hypothetical protein